MRTKIMHQVQMLRTNVETEELKTNKQKKTTLSKF